MLFFNVFNNLFLGVFMSLVVSKRPRLDEPNSSAPVMGNRNINHLDRDTLQILYSMMKWEDELTLSQVDRHNYHQWKKRLQDIVKKYDDGELSSFLHKLQWTLGETKAPLNSVMNDEKYLGNEDLSQPLFSAAVRILKELVKTPENQKNSLRFFASSVLKEKRELEHALLSDVVKFTLNTRWEREKSEIKAVLDKLKKEESAGVSNIFQACIIDLPHFLRGLKAETRGAAVMWTAIDCKKIILNLLLMSDKEANSQPAQSARETALASAIDRHGDREMIRHLLESGPIEEGGLLIDRNTKDNDNDLGDYNNNSSTRSQCVLKAAKKNDLGSIDELLTQAKLLDYDGNMIEAMHVAINNGNVPLFQLLSEKGFYPSFLYEEISQEYEGKERTPEQQKILALFPNIRDKERNLNEILSNVLSLVIDTESAQGDGANAERLSHLRELLKLIKEKGVKNKKVREEALVMIAGLDPKVYSKVDQANIVWDILCVGPIEEGSLFIDRDSKDPDDLPEYSKGPHSVRSQAILAAAQTGNLGVIKMLLDLRVNILDRDNNMLNALKESVIQRNRELFKLLTYKAFYLDADIEEIEEEFNVDINTLFYKRKEEDVCESKSND